MNKKPDKVPPAKISADNIIPDGHKRTKPPQEGQYKEAKNRKPGKKVKSRSGSVADLSEEPQGAAGGAASSDPNLEIDDTNFTTAGFSAESTVIEPDYRKDLSRKRSTTDKSLEIVQFLFLNHPIISIWLLLFLLTSRHQLNSLCQKLMKPMVVQPPPVQGILHRRLSLILQLIRQELLNYFKRLRRLRTR